MSSLGDDVHIVSPLERLVLNPPLASLCDNSFYHVLGPKYHVEATAERMNLIAQDLTIKLTITLFSCNNFFIAPEWKTHSSLSCIDENVESQTSPKVPRLGWAKLSTVFPSCQMSPRACSVSVETVSACGQLRDVEPRAFAPLVASFGCSDDEKLEHNLACILPAFEIASQANFLATS